MIEFIGVYALYGCMLIPLVIQFLFRTQNKEEKIHSISWSVPFPPDLLARLREFSPLAISRMSGLYLDDVFDILRGERTRTSPELIEKLNETIEKLKKRDEELEKQAAKLAYALRGLNTLEEQEQKKLSESNPPRQKKT